MARKKNPTINKMLQDFNKHKRVNLWLRETEYNALAAITKAMPGRVKVGTLCTHLALRRIEEEERKKSTAPAKNDGKKRAKVTRKNPVKAKTSAKTKKGASKRKNA